MKVELVKASTVELKPGHKYILAFDSSMVSHEDAANMVQYLAEVGFEDVIVAMFRGDPSKGLQVIEDPRGGAVKSA